MSGWSSSRSFGSSRSSMASARSVSSRSGSYTIGRGLTMLAVDALKLALDGSDSIKQEGDHFVHLQSELGDKRYRKLCEDGDLALTEIHYCQEGLDIARINVPGRGDPGLETVSESQAEEMRQMKDLINHDYLILKIQPGELNGEVVYIMAHKLRGGVHITHIPSSDVGSVFHEGVRCFTVDCDRGEKKRIRLWAIIAILKVEDPDYSLRTANCWDYAKNTAKRLVKGCAEVGGISAAEKARLLREHDSLEASLAFRHMHNIAKSLLRRISSGPARVSNPPRVSNSSRDLIVSRSAELSSPLAATAALKLAARVSNSSRSAELSSPRLATPEASALNPPRFSISSRDLVSSRSAELSSPLAATEALNLAARVSNSSRARLDFPPPQAGNFSSRPTWSEPINFSEISTPPPRVVERSSTDSPPTESVAAIQASSGKICLQIVFLLFWLIINNLGLGPWASSLLARGN